MDWWGTMWNLQLWRVFTCFYHPCAAKLEILQGSPWFTTLAKQFAWISFLAAREWQRCVLVVILKTPLDHRRQLIVDPFLGGSLHSFHLFQQLLHDIEAFLHRLSSYCHILPPRHQHDPGILEYGIKRIIRGLEDTQGQPVNHDGLTNSEMRARQSHSRSVTNQWRLRPGHGSFVIRWTGIKLFLHLLHLSLHTQHLPTKKSVFGQRHIGRHRFSSDPATTHLRVNIFEIPLEDVQRKKEVLLKMRCSAEPLNHLLHDIWALVCDSYIYIATHQGASLFQEKIMFMTM